MSKFARALEWLTGGVRSPLRDFSRILTAAFIALVIVYALRLWAIASGLWLVTPWDLWILRLAAFWSVWALLYLGLTWLLIIRSSAQQTREWALDQRVPPRPHISVLRSVILRVLRILFLASRTSSLFFIVLVSLSGLALAISLVPDLRDLETMRGVSLAFMAALGVISAWGVLHTSYGLHYAYLYYRSEESAGGLAFPGEQSPDQLDFAYFAFTIGTSFAVSDVDVTDRAIRRAVLGHQILSFFYNTTILALAIDLITG
ncbi:MAG: DUF1345 domain-containing protein [Rubrobacter sp.]|nr:DUF1345 domain-containing protein [Rubrobacter sp.]